MTYPMSAGTGDTNSYHQVNSSSAHEGELKGELWAGDHRPEGVFQSLKGMAMTPPELSFSEQDKNLGEVRYQGIAMSPGTDWHTHGPIESGTYNPDNLTHGTDKHMPK